MKVPPKTAPVVSVVVLSWNRREELSMTLEQVLNDDAVPVELIVVDNGSTDGSAEMVAKDFPEVILIRLRVNVGIGGLNVGMQKARGDYIVLLDDDSHPAPGCLGKMIRHFQADPLLGAAAFTIKNPKNNKSVWPAEKEVYPDGQAMIFIGCGVGLRRCFVEAVGYFDPVYFLYLNELYLTAQLIEAGYQVRHFPDLIAYHRVSPVHRTSLRTIFYAERNMLWFAWRFFPAGLALIFGPMRMLRLALYYLANRRPKECMQIVRASAAACLGLPIVLKDRQVLRWRTLSYLLPYLRKWYF